ncbi:MAG: peptide-methionine (S)-S-oxide reductase MsrA [Halocynthiibacter sp.]
MIFGTDKTKMVAASDAIKGRDVQMPITGPHAIFGRDMRADIPDGFEEAIFGMGCYWGVERLFWGLDGVWLTSVGFAGGYTPNPTYHETCTGKTGHTEVVRVVFDPSIITYEDLLVVFWENHNPTQGMRQGNDIGTQYRSMIVTFSEAQDEAALTSMEAYNKRLLAEGLGRATTEIVEDAPYYLAEEDHQQYLHKNPNGYCGLKGTGVTCAI